MSNSQAKKLKRKRELKERKSRATDAATRYFYEGSKYRKDRYVPLMSALESWLCSFDLVNRRGGYPGLTDETVGEVYRDMINKIRNDTFVHVGGKIEVPMEEAPRATGPMARMLTHLALARAEENAYSLDEISGVLRTLNASRLIWNELGFPSDRGYLDFLSRTIGPDPFRIVELLGLDDGVQETNVSE